MKDKTKYIIIIALFVALIGGFLIASVILEDKDISYSERRPLEQMPELNIKDVVSTEFMKDFGDYVLDQFPLREGFRKVKAFVHYNILGQKDNGGVYEYNGNISKLQYPLNENSIINASNKFNSLMQNYFPDANVYFSIIPDKNYFLTQENGYLDIDYDKLQQLMNDNIKGMQYINIFGELNADSYYNTDIHWKQEEIISVAQKLAQEMGFIDAIKNLSYDKTSLDGFYGVYGGQYALNVNSDTLTYLKNDLMKNWTVSILDEKNGLNEEGKFNFKEVGVYAPDRFNGTDPYDVFLHGATPLVVINNANNTSGKELFIFRDSFSSSITPLLVEGYSKVTLIDIRYMNSNMIGDYVDFGENNDILFMYGMEILNNSNILK